MQISLHLWLKSSLPGWPVLTHAWDLIYGENRRIALNRVLGARSDLGEALGFGFEVLPQPSERLCTQKPGWSIAY
jgi:hypothetical protein